MWTFVYFELDDGRYVGEWNHGKLTNGSWKTTKFFYVGPFENDKPHGKKGEMTDSKGTYSGCFVQGKRHGVNETFLFVDGSKIVGHWKEDKLIHGTLTDTKGDSYTGEFNDLKPHGTGKYHQFAGGDYSGVFVDGKRSGMGTMVYGNGKSYKGEWKDDVHHGRGEERWPSDGRVIVYNGEWRDHQKEGEGKEEVYDGDEACLLSQSSGRWSSGNKIDGTETYYYHHNDNCGHSDLSLCTFACYDRCMYKPPCTYTGAWKDGKWHGFGKLEGCKGNYIGQWKEGKKNGKGTYTLSLAVSTVFRNGDIVLDRCPTFQWTAPDGVEYSSKGSSWKSTANTKQSKKRKVSVFLPFVFECYVHL